jgi:hypothetical protein
MYGIPPACWEWQSPARLLGMAVAALQSGIFCMDLVAEIALVDRSFHRCPGEQERQGCKQSDR